MHDELQKLHDWLRNEAEERMKSAISRKDSAAYLRGATASELRDATALAEKMAGHKLLSVPGYEGIQERVAAKLESEARQLSAWTDLLAGIIKG
ncbi:MAG TPA: hypothetical protein VMQ76_02135 [Terracidiphilus sp.]|jgi:hypothetical protein|nr:hypothetical protein [Terracidiphilus sp.]